MENSRPLQIINATRIPMSPGTVWGASELPKLSLFSSGGHVTIHFASARGPQTPDPTRARAECVLSGFSQDLQLHIDFT